MEKAKNPKKLNTKKVTLKTSKINKISTQTKDTLQEKSKKYLAKRKNIIDKFNKSVDLNILKEEKKILIKQNSNDFNLTIKSDRKNNLTKYFISNSCKKREKRLKNNKTNDLFKSKKMAITHNFFCPISPDISTNYKKYLNQMKIKQNTIKNESIKNNLNNKLNKSNKSFKNNHIIFRNNKCTLNNNKLLNRSVELRKKMQKLKINENTEINLIKNKFNDKNKISEKLERNKNKENNKKIECNYEVCQTFSNKENIDNLQDSKFLNDINKKEKENSNTLKIKTERDKSIEGECKISKSKIYNNKKISKEFVKNKTINRAINNNNGNKKLKYLIREFCIDNSNKNNIKNKFVNKKTTNNIKNNNNNMFLTAKNEQKQLNINENRIKSNLNNNEIFEIMSDIKVKSFNEYEQEKEKINNLNIETKNTENDSKEINNNININININYNTINVNNPNSINDVFIEDRDEYNTHLKETFSKDRFSFKPLKNEIIKETDLKYYENIPITKNKPLNKKDFINKDDNKREKKYIKNKEKNKYIVEEIKKLKKTLKSNANNKINTERKKLNKFSNHNKNKK